MNLYYSIKFEMVCAKGVNFSFISLSNSENQYNLKIKSKFACPYLQFSAIWDFITTYRWFFIIIMVGVGIIECFFGRRLLNPTFFITGFGTGAATCSVILYILFIFIIRHFFLLKYLAKQYNTFFCFELQYFYIIFMYFP